MAAEKGGLADTGNSEHEGCCAWVDIDLDLNSSMRRKKDFA